MLALTVGLISVVVLPNRALAWQAGTFSSSDEALLFSLTNRARAAAGLAALDDSAALHGLAEWRSKDMATRHYFSHQIPPQGYLVFHYMAADGIRFVLAGENIGWEVAPVDEATRLVQRMFLASPVHRANILSPRWDAMGVGAYRASNGEMYYTVLFMESTPGARIAPVRRTAPHPSMIPARSPTPAPRQSPESPPGGELAPTVGAGPVAAAPSTHGPGMPAPTQSSDAPASTSFPADAAPPSTGAPARRAPGPAARPPAQPHGTGALLGRLAGWVVAACLGAWHRVTTAVDLGL